MVEEFKRMKNRAMKNRMEELFDLDTYWRL
jgi:hypothetical protein